MHDTGPNRPVTKSAPRRGHEQAGEHTDSGANPGNGAHVQAGAASRGLEERIAVRVNEGRDDEAEPRPGRGQDADQGPPAQAPGVYASSGDVDRDGEVVGRLRPAIADELAVDAEEHLAAVLRMLATSAAMRAAERTAAGWSL